MPVDENDPKSLIWEIERLKADKRELAAELEKTQRILLLQYDLVDQNEKYYGEESKALKTQLEVMEKRMTDQRRMLETKDIELTNVKTTVHRDLATAGRLPVEGDLDKAEITTEFSIASQETGLRPEENMLDLAIDMGDFFGESLRQVIDTADLTPKSFQTFLTVEFYDHDTKATDVVEGFKPVYSTQFSFLNKVDNFYLKFMESKSMKVEVFLAKAQRAEPIGFANILLRDLLESNTTSIQTDSNRQPVIKQITNIISIKDNWVRIGSFSYKIRMRKPMNEALRWYKEKEGLTIAPPKYAATEGIIHPILLKKFITVWVEECWDLVSKGSKSIVPFFYYQFYTFDEHYSATLAGANPIYQDEKGYEIDYDDKFKSYADTQRLEIFLFDDAAPMEGETDEKVDDMIGTAIVDLKPLSLDKNIHDLFVVRDNEGNDVGSIEVKIMAQDITPSG